MWITEATLDWTSSLERVSCLRFLFCSYLLRCRQARWWHIRFLSCDFYKCSFKWIKLMWIGYVLGHINTYKNILNYFTFFLLLTKQLQSNRYFKTLFFPLFSLAGHWFQCQYIKRFLRIIHESVLSHSLLYSELVQNYCQTSPLCSCICFWAAIPFVKSTLKAD